MEGWESNLINRGRPSNRGSRASLLPLPWKPVAAPLPPTPLHPPWLHRRSLSSSSPSWGLPGEPPSQLGMMCWLCSLE